jgi:hypothetical protein
MDPHALIEQTTAGVPAPLWFVELFKILGFTLHSVPMNLWYAGLLVALGLQLGGSEPARRFAARLLGQMPVIVAVGVNLGIVPLLFVQLAYYKFFYPATILMAWFWLAIIGLLIPAYYGVYIYAGGLARGPGGLSRLRRAAGWGAAVFFIAIGFLFANGMSLVDHVERWPELFGNHSHGGAALGTALNLGDATLWPRWLLMFGLALGTTAVWLLVDAAWFGAREGEPYRRWAAGFAPKLYTVGMTWAAIAGAGYVFLTWTPELRATMFSGLLAPLTVLTALAPGVPWALMMVARQRPVSRAGASLAGLAQLGVLGMNAVSRQVVQNVNLREYLDVLALPTDVQWGPLAMFLIAFVIGLGVVAWMVRQVVRGTAKATD